MRNLHGGVHQLRVDRGNIYCGEDVSIHVVDSGDEVDVCRVGKQLVRLLR